jgi:hypothetical protein
MRCEIKRFYQVGSMAGKAGPQAGREEGALESPGTSKPPQKHHSTETPCLFTLALPFLRFPYSLFLLVSVTLLSTPRPSLLTLPTFSSFIYLFFWWDWSLKSGLHATAWAILLVHFALVILEMGVLWTIYQGWPQTVIFLSQPHKLLGLQVWSTSTWPIISIFWWNWWSGSNRKSAAYQIFDGRSNDHQHSSQIFKDLILSPQDGLGTGGICAGKGLLSWTLLVLPESPLGVPLSIKTVSL